jgi:dTDP-4-dehydrorhamnose reductase
MHHRRAESEPELAFRINAEAPEVMAREAKTLGAAMVHYSTDYVFDGSKAGAYVETDATGPLNVYGKSKLAGEQAIAAAGIPHLILRTSWVYGMRGSNFLLTMLRLAKERDALNVVSDQIGAPTWCRTLADTTAVILAQARGDEAQWWQRNSGIYHLSSQGQTSWYGFTEAIVAAAGLECQLTPIGSDAWPTPAPRPRNSVHDPAMGRRIAAVS